MKFVARLFAVFAVLVSAGCATSAKSDQKLLESTLRSYGSVMRWGDVAQAVPFIDPAVLEERPIDAVTLERFKQVQIAGYRERSMEMVNEFEAMQIVQIDLVNRHTQEVRSLVDRQFWRWDPVEKRWWLMSGLPDITPPTR
jgi:hypothetical protein